MGNKVGLALGGLAVVAIGGGMYWFFAIHSKEVQREAAAAEITRWETRLDAARTCVTGPKPASSDLGEAMAVRELSPDPWEFKTCTKLFGALARGDAEDTGLMPVEHAWMTLDRAATKAATAFAVHKDPWGMSAADRRKGVADLPAALVELDAAHAALRTSAGMPPLARAAGAKLPTVEAVPLLLGKERITDLETRQGSDGKSVVAWVGPQQRGVLDLVAGKPPTPSRITTEGPMRAVPDGTWGMDLVDGALVAGAMDAGSSALTAPSPVTKIERGKVLAVVGARETGAFAATIDDEKTYATKIVFGHAAAGAFALGEPELVTGLWRHLDPATGRMLVVWATPDEDGANRVRATILDGKPTARVVELGTDAPRTLCMTRALAYVGTDDQTFQTDGAMMAAVPYADGDFWLKTCGDTSALLSNDSNEYVVCSDTCRKVRLPGARGSQVSTLANDQVLSVFILGKVLAVWRENKEPLFYALPDVYDARVVVSDGKTVDVLAVSVPDKKVDDHVAVTLRVALPN